MLRLFAAECKTKMAWPGLTHAKSCSSDRPRACLTRKTQAEPCGEQDVIALVAENRIAEIAVACGHLPGKPFLECRDRAQVEIDAVITGVAQIREETERLRHRTGAG